MDKKQLWEKFKRPTGWRLVGLYIFTLLACAGSLAVLFIDYEGTWLEYVTYVIFALAALSLAYTTYTVVIYAPRLKSRVMDRICRYPFLLKLKENFGYRTIIFTFFSLSFSFIYSLYNGGIAIAFRSVWYGSLAAYYVLLVCIRGGIILYHGKTRNKLRDEETEIRKYRSCGILLIVTILALSVAIAQMVSENAFFDRSGLLIYVSAAYTFTKLTMSIINFLRAQKYTGFTIRALRNVNFADALVSILALQTSMFHSFAQSNTATDVANALTGGLISLLVLALGVYMIVSANKALKRLRNGLPIEQKEF